jgi:hypothetical protein
MAKLKGIDSMSTVKVICRLPHGLVINHPVTGVAVELKGANSDRALNSTVPVLLREMYGVTDVDSEFWDAWEKANKDFPAYKNQAISVAADDKSVVSKVADLLNIKTGFEAKTPQDGKVKAAK